MNDDAELFTIGQLARRTGLIGVINGRAPFEPSAPAFEWLIAALRASA
jgi:hypothetical protein